jgi:hypothetical protein
MKSTQSHFCQSCSMPMSKPEDLGTYADGSPNDEFCHYCFEEGKFTEPNITLTGMIEKCTAMMKQMGAPDIQIEQTKAFMPMLKRWKTR